MADDRREGRGRLSSIDLLPEEAEPDIKWALDALRDREMHQTAILAEFNSRLADRGIAGVSKSAFSRWSVRKAFQLRRLDMVRTITKDVVARLGTDGADDVTMLVAEMVKVAAYDLLEPGELDSKGLQEVSRALNSAVAAQKASAEHRRKLQEEVEQRLKKAAEEVKAIGTKTGVSEDALEKITSLLTTGGY